LESNDWNLGEVWINAFSSSNQTTQSNTDFKISLCLVLGFHYGILQWIWRGVNPKCIDAYAVLEWANDTKLHVFATKHKANTCSEQLTHSDDCVSILFCLTRRQIYDVIWNPRIRESVACQRDSTQFIALNMKFFVQNFDESHGSRLGLAKERWYSCLWIRG
jgi:hypothetical protein